VEQKSCKRNDVIHDYAVENITESFIADADLLSSPVQSFLDLCGTCVPEKTLCKLNMHKIRRLFSIKNRGSCMQTQRVVGICIWS
jgi:hypothetical protein